MTGLERIKERLQTLAPGEKYGITIVHLMGMLPDEKDAIKRFRKWVKGAGLAMRQDDESGLMRFERAKEKA